MLSKPINPNQENKRKPSPAKTKPNKPKKENVDGTIRMTYSLEEKKEYYEDDGENVRLFGEKFVQRNKDKCRMIIGGKEYEVKDIIKKTELKDYGIKEDDKELEVMLKGDGITDMSCMFSGCISLVKLDLSSFDTQNVTSMESMFMGCESLVKVIRKNFGKVIISFEALLSRLAIIEV